MARRSVAFTLLLVVGLTVAALWSVSSSSNSEHGEVLTSQYPLRPTASKRNASWHVGIVILVHHHPAPRDAAFFAGSSATSPARPTPGEVFRFHALTLDGALVLRHSLLSRTTPAAVTSGGALIAEANVSADAGGVTATAVAPGIVGMAKVQNRRRRCWREFRPVDQDTLLLERDGACVVPVHQLDVPWAAVVKRDSYQRSPQTYSVTQLRDGPVGTTSTVTQRGLLHNDEPLLQIQLRFVALVTPAVSAAHLAILRRYGFETWATNDSVVELSNVESASYRRDVVDDGAFGFAELVKLKALRMGGAGMFDTVIVLDNDIMFHQSLVELLRECVPWYLRAMRGDKDSEGVGDDEEDAKNLARRRQVRGPDDGIVLHWTRGGISTEPINGGYLIFSPRLSANKEDMADAGSGGGDDDHDTLDRRNAAAAAPLAATSDVASAALAHYEKLLAIVRRGNYTPDAGWEGSGVGRGTHGGRTLQGLLPYYFLHVLQRNDSTDTVPATSSLASSSSREIDRCRFNNMVQLPRCQALRNPATDVVSNHFTGGCLKPWKCFARSHPLCARFVEAWLQEYQIAAREVLRTLQRKESSAASEASTAKATTAATTIAAKHRRKADVVSLLHFLDSLERRNRVNGSGDCLPSASESGHLKQNRVMLRKLRSRRDLVFVSLTETLLKST